LLAFRPKPAIGATRQYLLSHQFAEMAAPIPNRLSGQKFGVVQAPQSLVVLSISGEEIGTQPHVKTGWMGD
jgi:hypothetical protein